MTDGIEKDGWISISQTSESVFNRLLFFDKYPLKSIGYFTGWGLECHSGDLAEQSMYRLMKALDKQLV